MPPFQTVCIHTFSHLIASVGHVKTLENVICPDRLRARDSRPYPFLFFLLSSCLPLLLSSLLNTLLSCALAPLSGLSSCDVGLHSGTVVGCYRAEIRAAFLPWIHVPTLTCGGGERASGIVAEWWRCKGRYRLRSCAHRDASTQRTPHVSASVAP